MRKLLITLILMFTGANVAYATDGYDTIARAAHQLENAAGHFYQQLRNDAGYDHATRDAKKFARAARHFHRQVEHGGSYRHIRGDYAELVNAYVHVKREFGERRDLHHNRHLRRDFRGVERAFHDLERSVAHARNRYSRHRGYDRYDRRDNRDHRSRRNHSRYDSGVSITFKGNFGF